MQFFFYSILTQNFLLVKKFTINGNNNKHKNALKNEFDCHANVTSESFKFQIINENCVDNHKENKRHGVNPIEMIIELLHTDYSFKVTYFLDNFITKKN